MASASGLAYQSPGTSSPGCQYFSKRLVLCSLATSTKTAQVTATPAIVGVLLGGSVVLHASFIALTIRRAHRVQRPEGKSAPPTASFYIPALLAIILGSLGISTLDISDAISLLAFTWLLPFIIWITLPWLYERLGDQEALSTAWPMVLGLASLAIIILCMVAGELLAQRLIRD